MRVLNAFRHQRNDHNLHQQQAHTSAACSTPSGIKGTITVASAPMQY